MPKTNEPHESQPKTNPELKWDEGSTPKQPTRNNMQRGYDRDISSQVFIDGKPHPFLVGVGPDVPKVTNEHGGQRSELNYRFDLMDPQAMFALAKILDYGVRVRGYPEDNWRLIPARDNINHALVHLYAHLAGDTQDDHLAHAFCRVMFALGVELAGGVPTK